MKKQPGAMRLLVVSVAVLLSAAACQNPSGGLGGQIDIEGPRVTLSSHSNLDFIRGQQTLEGSASDNFEVTRVVLSASHAQGWATPGLPAEAVLTRDPGSKDVTWRVALNTEAIPAQDRPAWQDGEYLFKIQAFDAPGNAAAASVLTFSLTIDNDGPRVNVNEPRLQEAATAFTALTTAEGPGHQNLATLDYFQNGQFRLRGNVDENFGLSRLAIRLYARPADQLSADSTVSESLALERVLERNQALPLGVEGNLWNWIVNIDGRAEGVADPLLGLNLNPDFADAEGRYYLRVATEARDQSGNFEVSDQGWLCYFPAADRPWTRLGNLSEDLPVAPSSQVAGNVYDDDGVAKLYVRVQRRNPGIDAPAAGAYLGWAATETVTVDSSEKVVTVAGTSSRLVTWTLTLPSQAGEYTLYLQAEDIHGTTLGDYQTLNFVIQDQDFPVNRVDSPADYAEILGTDFTLSGLSYDDSGVSRLLVAWVPLGVNGAALLGPELWTAALAKTPDPARGYYLLSDHGNIRVWDLSGVLTPSTLTDNLPIAGQSRMARSWSKAFNVALDLDVGDLNFVFQTRDESGNLSYSRLALLGDRSAPSLVITAPAENGLYLPSSPESPYTLAGTWSDNSGRTPAITVKWVEKSKESGADPSEYLRDATVTNANNGTGTWSLALPFDFPDGANNLEITAEDASGNQSFALRYLIVVNNVPVIGRVTSSAPNGAYTFVNSDGDDVDLDLTVEFNQPVIVNTAGGTPTLALNTGAQAVYVSGSETPNLTFRYQVLAGHNTGDLNYTTVSALALNGGSIRDAAGNNANINLPDPSHPASLGGSKNLLIDTAAPTVTGVTSSTSNGFFRADGSISIQVTFSEPVLLDGASTLRLNTHPTTVRNAVYALGSGSANFSYLYTVLPGDNAADLEAHSLSALNGSFTDLAGNPAVLTLPVLGGPQSLSGTKALVIDTAAPTAPLIAGVAAGAYNTNQTFSLTGTEAGATVQYSLNGGLDWLSYTAPVLLSAEGIYTLTARQSDQAGNVSALAANRQVTIDKTAPFAPLVSGIFAGAFSTDQIFTVIGEPGSALEYSLNNGATWQAYSTNVTLSANGTYQVRARQTDSAGNISEASTMIQVIINKIPPVVTGVTSPTTDGSFKESGSITIAVTFDIAVYVTGSPRLKLNSGPAAYATYASGTGSTSLSFSYFVGSGENSSDLDYASTGAFELNGGTIKDLVGNNAVLTLPAPGAAGSLGANKALVVDTVAPAAPTISGLGTSLTNANQTFTLSGEPGATFQYSLNNGLSWADYSGEVTISQAGGTRSTYAVTARQRDLAGNLSPEAEAVALTIDKVSPAAPLIIGLVNGSYNDDRSFTIAGEEGASFQYVLNYTGTDESAPWEGSNWITTAGSVTLSTPGTYAIRARQRDAAGNVGPSGSPYAITIDKTSPIVTGVTSPTDNGSYNALKVITITVTFDKVVYVIGAPRLQLNSGGSVFATYATGTGTETLSFTYTVQAGHTSADLDYSGTTALGLNGGTIKDVLGNNAVLTLAAPGTAGSLGANKALVIDTTAPAAPTLSGISAGAFNSNQTLTLTGLESGAAVQYSLNNGLTWTAYSAGVSLNTDGTYDVTARQTDLAGNISAQAATVSVTIDKTAPAAPFIGGLVAGLFNTDQSFTLTGEPGALALQYTLNNGSSWQDYSGEVTLSANGSYTIRARQTDAAGNPSPLTAAISVTINKTAPTITGVTSPTSNGHYRESGSVTVAVSFDAAVYVTGAPRILLNSGAGAYANYASGTGTSTLNFTYFVSAGENSADLDYASSSALSLNGGTIKDLVGNNAVLSLPTPGAAGSLGANKALVIDTTLPLAPAFSGISAGTFNTDRSFTLSGEAGATLEYSTNNGLNWTSYPGAAVSITQGAGTQGSYLVTARQRDQAGNLSPEVPALAVTIDKIAPAAPFISGITGGSFATEQSFQVFGEVGASLEYSTNNGASWSPYSLSVSLNPGAGAQATYQVLARQTDAAGNLGPNTSVITLTVDRQAPTISTYLPAHNAVDVSANGSISLTFSEPVFRENGNITIKRVTGSLPLVLTVAQYSEYLSQLTVLGNTTNTNAFVAAYRLTTNGVLAGGAPDPSAKYVLEFSRGYSDATLLPIFETLGYNDRVIAVDSTQVTGSGTNTITISPAGGLPIGIEYYVTIAATAFRDRVGNTFAGISNNTTYRFTTGPVATPVIRVNRISANGYTSTTALTTTFKIDVETPGASLVYSMPSTSTTTDSAADYANPTATAPATAYTSAVTLGDAVYAKGWRYYIQAQATKSGLSASAIAGERAYRTVLRATNPWFRGSNNSGGPTTAPGFPLRWEDNAVGYIRQGVLDGGNYYFVTWEIAEYLHFKALAGGAMTTTSNPAGYPAGTYEAGPSSYGWGAGANYNVFPGGYRIAAHASYEALADRRGDASTWIYRPLGQ